MMALPTSFVGAGLHCLIYFADQTGRPAPATCMADFFVEWRSAWILSTSFLPVVS